MAPPLSTDVPADPPPEAAGLDAAVRKAAVGGAVWTVLGHAAQQGCRLVFNLVLTHLLAPRVFGVTALVTLFVLGLHQFSDLGVRQCVVHSRRGDDPAFLDVAWTVQALRGLLLWGCAGLLAWPAAAFYDVPALAWMLPVAGSTAALNGLNAPALLVCSRRLLRGRLVLVEVGSYLVQMTVVVTWVWLLGPGAGEDAQLRALVSGTVIAGLCELAGSYLVLPRRLPRFRWERAARRELVHFGGWVFVGTACTFLASQADRLVVGKISVETLGVYQLAVVLAAVPVLVMNSLGAQLVFPLYSRLLRAGRGLREVFGGVHRVVSGFGALLVAWTVAAGPALVDCLWDPRYHAAGAFLRLLGVATWFTVLQGAGELALLARGQTRRLALGQAVRLAVLPPLLWVGYELGGLGGLVVGFGAAEVVRYGMTVGFLRREGLAVLRADAVTSGLFLAVALSAAALDGVLAGGLPKWPRLGLDVLLVVVLWAAAFGLRQRGALVRGLRDLRRRAA
jgi:O-antigen/teichoic acid export membrane protein